MDDREPRPRLRLTLGTQIVIGLAAGIGCGLFFGEYCRRLGIVGDAFVALLQMTVLPYIAIAIIVNIGGLTLGTARQLAVKAGLFLLALWAVVIGLITIMPLVFPDVPSASFFSTSLIEQPAPIDYIELYIPSNPFHSLAESLIPAAVLFAIALGIALIGIPEKSKLIEPCRIVIQALTRINDFVVRLTPIGVFALTATAAGTLTISDIGRIQAYLITYIVSALLLAYWILPMLVAALTPFGYREVLRVSRAARVTAFATDNLFICLPLLIGAARRLFALHGHEEEQSSSSIDVVLPVAFTFPNLGKLLTLLFVPFAAWYIGREMTIGQWPGFVVSGLLSYFGATSLAMPFLLDLVRLPADFFQLFIVTGVFAGRFGTFLAATYLLVFTVLTTCAMMGTLALNRRRLAGFLVATVVLVAIATVSARAYLDRSVGGYTKDEVLRRMQMLTEHAEFEVLPEAAPNPVPLRPGLSRLERIHERDLIRVGFEPDALPGSYENDRGELVGFDIELACILARDLGVGVEFVPIRRIDVAEHLDQDHCDIAMIGMPGSVSRYEQMLTSDPYFNFTPALIVPDYRRRELDTHDEARSIKGLRVGVQTADAYITERLHEFLPNAEVVVIDSVRSFFEGEHPDLDALAFDAEGGSAWTVLYPDYSVVFSLTDRILRWPLVYPLAPGDREFAELINDWIELQRRNGTLDRLEDHWILGRTAEQRGPRWCVIRDVLHWVD